MCSSTSVPLCISSRYFVHSSSSGLAKLVSNRGQNCTFSFDMNKCKTTNAANSSLPGVMAIETNVQ
jgi:hypothetical protein